ncbi:MAG: hypothetical protein IJ191_10265 [Treponema sp.]|nr:hypothetical protein [Treponema sp.]
MRSIIIDGFSNFDLENIVNNAPFDKIFYIGEPSECLQNIPNVVCYNCYDLPVGIYPHNFFETEPLDEEIIKKFYSCESIVMKMFERNDFWFQASFNQRKEWYFMHLRYWYHMIHIYNCVCFMKSNFAHEVYDYVIYAIMKERGGRCFFFSQLSFMNRFILEEDIFTYPRLNEYLKQCSFEVEINSEVRKYLEEKRLPAKDTKDVFQVIEKKRGIVKNQHKIITVYNKKYAETPVPGETYYFVALHMQPEMTTSPLAGQFVYQELIIELLDFYLPNHIFIYIKEHPAQTTVGRSFDFYKRFYNRKRIRFIKTNVNSRILADNALAVVTCTGSIGWEALIRCKPVLLFGNFFYETAPGCFLVKNKKDLCAAVKSISDGINIDKTEIDLFFQKVYNYSFFGYVDTACASLLSISEEQNNNNVLNLIQEKIYRCFNTTGSYYVN